MTADSSQLAGVPWDVAVVGAGAAGFLASIFAARRGARVALLETRPSPGAKIRVSGGGRCNILPSLARLDDFDTSGSGNTMRNILFSWPLEKVRAFFEEELAIPLKVEPNGKVFPVSDRALDVVQALLREHGRAGATLLMESRVERAVRIDLEAGPGFRLELEAGRSLECRRLILATGGLSLPKTGSDGGGFAIARSLGHSLRETYPALVPLVASDGAWGSLAGISLRVVIRAEANGRTIEEREGDFLFTHRGFSGPVTLDMSRHVTRPGGETTRLLAKWGGAAAPPWDELLREPGKRTVASILRERLPRRLADRLLEASGVPEGRATSELRRDERRGIVELLSACPLGFSGSEGYRVAEVTAGGIPLDEVSPRTLESRIVPGLHFAGEILDVVGRIGGYNFLWAWVTGRKAGEAAAEAMARSGPAHSQPASKDTVLHPAVLIQPHRPAHLRIEPVPVGDAPVFLGVMRLAFESLRGRLYPPSGAHEEPIESVRDSLSLGGGFLAHVGGDVVGCARWRLEPDHLYGSRIGVLPGWRRSGVGAALMHALEDVARGAGLLQVEVEVREPLTDNLRFYESLGYRRLGIRRHPGGPDRVIRLGRRLD